jgi:hypothetical protein
MRKTAIITAIAAFVLAAPAAAFAASFSDLTESHWAFTAIAAASEAGIVDGYPDGSFKPSNTLTYGEFIKMLHIANGGKKSAAGAGDWALPYYEAACEAGLFAKHEISDRALSVPIPREYMALMLGNALGDVPAPNYDEVREKLIDVEWNTPHGYEIVKAAANGLITGYPDGTFRPEGTLTRAEAAVVIRRLTDPENREVPSDPAPAADNAEDPAENPEEDPAAGLADKPVDVTKTPLERLKALPEGKYYNPILQVVADSDSVTAPLSDIIDGTVLNGISNEPVLYYEIFENYPYRMKKVLNLVGDEALEVGINGVVGHLIRDRKITAELREGLTKDGTGTVYVSQGEGYDAETFPDFDYIGVTVSTSNVMLLIPNNMR